MDRDHLRLLAIFHYVLAGLMGLMVPFAAAPAVVGSIISRALPTDVMAVPVELHSLLVLLSVAMVVTALLGVAGLVLTGLFLARQRHYYFCLVSAGCNTLFWPFGTVLAVLTLIVLLRPSVRQLFGVAGPTAPTPGGAPTR